jgi:hypothetical protein
VDLEGNQTWKTLMIHAVPLMRYMGKGTDGPQKIREEFEEENAGITILTQVRWLANPCTIRERRQNGEIAASSVVFLMPGSNAAQGLVRRGIMAARV